MAVEQLQADTHRGPEGDPASRRAREQSDSAVMREMAFGDHLEELRWRLILALLGPLVMCAVTLPLGWKMVSWLLTPLTNILSLLDLPPQAYALGVSTGFSVYARVSIVAALILACPWVIYQLWKFLAPGLYAHERRAAVLVAPLSAVMSFLAVVFLYYVMLPVCLGFLLFFTTSFPTPPVVPPGHGGFVEWLTGAEPHTTAKISSEDPESVKNWPHIPILKKNPAHPTDGEMWIKMPQRELRVAAGGQVYRYMPFHAHSLVQPMIDINQYVSFVVWLALGVLLAFQTPVVMLILGWTRLIDPAWLSRYRGHCIFACAILAAIFSPPDVFAMLTLMLPLYALFEFGLVLMRIAYRRGAV